MAPELTRATLRPRGAQPLQLVGQGLDAGRFQGAVGAGQHVGADLDDDGVGQGDDFLANRIDHAVPRSWESGLRFLYGSAAPAARRISFHETDAAA